MDDQTMKKIDDLNTEISLSENELEKAEEEIKLLKEKKLKMENPDLIKEENEDLKLTHELCIEDIKAYNEKIIKLKEMLTKKEEKLSKLREENINLKKDTNIKKEKPEPLKNLIFDFKELFKSIGLKSVEMTDNDVIENNMVKDEENIKMINKEKVEEKQKEFEKILDELKNKANQINSIVNKQKEIINEHKKYLNEINSYLSKFREKLNISINNKILNNNKSKIKEIKTLVDKNSVILLELDNIIKENKDNSGQSIENLLINIQNDINDLNLNDNKNEANFENKCEEINKKINSIKDIFNNFEINKNKFYKKNINVEKGIKELKNEHNQLIEQEKKNIINNKKNNDAKNKNKNINNSNNNNNANKRKKIIEQSFLYNVKNANKKLDLYKTVNLFKNDENELDNNIEFSELIKKNYHEICYIYDEYDIHDIYYTLKAVGLPDNESFLESNLLLDNDDEIEILEFTLDDIPSNYSKENSNYITFNINLYNLDSIKVHIIYKEKKDLSNKLHFWKYYGLNSNFAGINSKYSLILKCNYDIIDFDEFFLIRNINNQEEVEYIWGGVIPNNGKRVKITFSKKEAIWSFEQKFKFNFEGNIKNAQIFIPVEFVGGNNEIINITPSSPQTKNITLDEKNKQYIIKFINIKSKVAEIIIKGKLKNKCKGGWNINLTDKEVEKLMPEEDVKNKNKLKQIAQKIIDDFDKNNKNNDFEFLDYMKIVTWVKNNIKYDYNLVLKKHSALQIYNMKTGVCYHYTRLSNALLYALGYKVLHVSGYCSDDDNEFGIGNLHAFSLIKLKDNKWYPFDSTWGVFTGKLHVGHVFRMIGNKNFNWRSLNYMKSYEKEIIGKLIK